MKLNIGISREMGGLTQNPFHRGGMDIFWNYTLLITLSYLFLCECISGK